MHRRLYFVLVFLVAVHMAPADVTFNVQFEADSKWFTESWSANARAGMQAFLTDVGRLFQSNATATISVDDNETSAYASTGSAWWTTTPVAGREGLFHAPALWSIIVKNQDTNGDGPDVNIHWNMDLSLYSGDSARLINNIRGLGRHEMNHAFGAASFLSHTASYDPRGSSGFAGLLENLARDLNGSPLMGAYNAQTGKFDVNQYTVAANWTTMPGQTGLYFEARNLRGEVRKMPFYSSSTYIDFSHIYGIAYVSDHPTWYTYEEPDLNFLRALGYPLTVDAQLTGKAGIMEFKLNTDTAEITMLSAVDRWYRIASSSNLRNWEIQPWGVQGTGAALKLTVPVNLTAAPSRFFQVMSVP